MKKLTLLFTVLFAGIYLSAQNVAINNDGTSAAGSAMLDVKSTTKGFMMPRVTSAQRSTIASPSLGLLVFDTDTKTIWAYDGSSWKNLYTTGGLSLPFAQTVNVPGAAFSITNTSGAIQGVSSNNTTAALTGTNNSTGGIGVIGSSSNASGIGVSGQSSDGTGVFGFSNSGVAVKASSINGLALQVNGNVKISGGNTNPTNGAVLTSDATGNAVWKANRIGFHALGVNASHDDLNSDTWYKVIFPNELYDFANNFNSYSGNSIPAPADASVFIVPVEGVYHFEAYFALWVSEISPSEVSARVRVSLNRNGSISELEETAEPEKSSVYTGTTENAYIKFKISLDYLLFPGDKIYLEVYHSNESNTHAEISSSYSHRFSGRLVIPY